MMNQDCWNQIGVMGDRTCPELTTFIHCRNCPVYSAGGRRLLEREAPDEYREEWTKLLANDGSHAKGDRREERLSTVGENVEIVNQVSVLIFRLGIECFALSAKLFREVTSRTMIHQVPHRTNQTFLGLANVRGELLLCISLKHLLGLSSQPNETTAEKSMRLSPVVYQRTIAIEKNGKSWVFEADEIYGIHRLTAEDLRNVPAVSSKSTKAYTQGIIQWNDRSVNLLDDELLFYTLDRRIL